MRWCVVVSSACSDVTADTFNCSVPDYKHLLHPRSTGLFFAFVKSLPPSTARLIHSTSQTTSALARRLRSHTVSQTSSTLQASTQPLHIFSLDLTIAYPSILPPPIWPEDHYSLSIWSSAVPPPQIHVHLRSWDVRKEIPLGDLSVAGSEGTPEEKQVFEEWLREVWREKDELMERFNRDGSFGGDGIEGVGTNGMTVDEKKAAGEGIAIPLELRSNWEILPSLSYFLPVIFAWIGVRLIR